MPLLGRFSEERGVTSPLLWKSESYFREAWNEHLQSEEISNRRGTVEPDPSVWFHLILIREKTA